MRYDVVTLLADAAPHGAFDAGQETGRQLYAGILTATRAEAYAAMSAGHSVDIVFFLAVPADYEGERAAAFGGKRYRVVRAYENERGLYLSCQEVRPA
jgi:hypothetical protein